MVSAVLHSIPYYTPPWPLAVWCRLSFDQMRSCSIWKLSPTLFFLLGVILWISCDAKNYKGGDRAACHDHEREALVKFRSGLEYDLYHQVATWDQIATGDCCEWGGVKCDTQTGYVLQLHLFPDLFLDNYDSIWDSINKTGRVSGHLDPVLLELEHLRILDLSGNAFTGMPIPEFLGSFKDLQCLNLSYSQFAGQIPHQLGNLSNLEQLDIQGSHNFSYDLSANSLHWLKGMPMLKILRIHSVNLSEIGNDWIQVLNDGLPSLNKLDLRDCSIGKITTTITSINFNHLRELLLPLNEFESKFPSWIANISSLESVDLHNNGFHGTIPSSICGAIPDLSSNGIEGLPETCLQAIAHPLPNLRVLNLGYNDKMSGPIPSWLGKLRSLEELDLSNCNLSGPIPPNFGDLSSLRILSLQGNLLSGPIPPNFGHLSSLSILYLCNNCLSGPIPPNFGHLSSLSTLYLDNNYLSGPIPPNFGDLLSLRILYLNNNLLSGPIPPNFGHLSSLRILYLHDNRLSGPIPPNVGELSSLRTLYLQNNCLSGILPTTIWNLSRLGELLLHNNSLMGRIGDVQLNQLKELIHLDLSSNLFVLHLASDWAPAFQLKFLKLEACSLGPSFPQWLITQKSLSVLVLSNTSIEDSLPSWFWDFASQLRSLDLSHNKIKGLLPKTWNYSFMYDFDLSNNQFSGPLPQTYFTPLSYLFLVSDNQITGTIPNLLCDEWTRVVNLAQNHIVGNIPSGLGNCSGLESLDLSGNYLTGELPFSISKLNSLASLCLADNKLSGTIPLSLRNASALTLLDLGENNLSGNLSPLVHNTRLRIVSLRSNKFTGALPSNFSSTNSLQILDLSDNMLSGLIPKSIGQFSLLVTEVSSQSMILDERNGSLVLFSIYVGKLVMAFKGKDLLYDKNLGLVGGIDLSRNNFYGEIPKELTRLKGLIFLNLSNNHFTGTIPENIGELKRLESLDISCNQLEGEIPSSFLQLTFLVKLNLSNNHLRGRIPMGGQLQILGDSSIYEGNIGLCGSPLEKQCVAIDSVPTTPDLEDEKGDDRRWLYMGMMFGFVLGFWVFWGLLIFNKSTRIAFYSFFDAMTGKLFNLIVIYLAKVKTKM